MLKTTLVTITCSRDRAIQKLQSYTIDKFIQKSCCHIIIVEDNQIPLWEWQKELGSFYTNHKLVLMNSWLDNLSYKNDSYKKNGWHRSALLKLLAAEYVTTEKYLLLDSKNFFVKQANLDNWPCEEGNHLVEPLHSNSQLSKGRLSNGRLWPNLFEFGKKHKIPISQNTYSTTTPFMVQTHVVKKLLKLDIASLFLNSTGWSSELFLYSVYAQYLGIKLINGPTINVTFWNNERTADTETLTDIFSWTHLLTFGFHRDFMKLNLDLIDLYNFLTFINFDRQLVESCFDQYRKDLNEQRR